MSDCDIKYCGCGFYISRWKSHDGSEGNLFRETSDLMYGDSNQYAFSEKPEAFINTFANYVEIAELN